MTTDAPKSMLDSVASSTAEGITVHAADCPIDAPEPWRMKCGFMVTTLPDGTLPDEIDFVEGAYAHLATCKGCSK